MQFHLNGFRPGDPSKPAVEPPPREDRMPAEVDVLIVGCGPAGLTLATQMAAFGTIRTAIVDQKPGPLQLGQADGVACRTMEMFEAFGFSERVLKESYWVNETTFWRPGTANGDGITRGGRIQDTEDGLSEFPHTILNQARVHDFLLDAMRDGPARIEPYYARGFLDLRIAPAADGPVTVRLERVDEAHKGEVETVRARYVVGCDGARSRVRRALGLSLNGDSANVAWGVMDVLLVTDFPDVRMKSVIQSAGEGSVIIIPREGGYLIRLYVELDKLGHDERVAQRAITVDQVIAQAQRIFRPYTLDVKEVAWWSVYEIGQRLCDRFDDVPPPGHADEVARIPRVFIAGDACHTHSPKAGQGMNMSMADGFNLGWKLGAVLNGRSPPALLRSYSAERQAVAEELIDFDRKISHMISSRAHEADPAEFQRYFVQQGRFTAGTAIHYAPSAITAEARHQHLAPGFVAGMRFHSAPVVRLADAKPMQLGHALKADGRWRILLFAGAGDTGKGPVADTCEFLSRAHRSPLRRYTPEGEDIDSVIDLRAVFPGEHRSLAIEAMPALLLPHKGRYGLLDYEKVFCADHPAGNVFDMRGISRDGCIVVVRPDQFVADVLPLSGHDALAAFFDGVMLPVDAPVPVPAMA